MVMMVVALSVFLSMLYPSETFADTIDQSFVSPSDVSFAILRGQRLRRNASAVDWP